MNIENIKIEKLRSQLFYWAKGNIRSFPWRYVAESYPVLVSEFMLHRTQVKQVIRIYQSFMVNYPTLAHYVEGDVSKIQEILTPLGLNWRIYAMTQALHELWKTYHSVPPEIEQLIKIPGIGQYIASATVCFTQNKPVTLIDTNIVRVIGRVFGLDLRGEARRRKNIIEMISKCCDPVEPRDFYYALIDLAHSVCLPKVPKCSDCPLLSIPCAFGHNSLNTFTQR